MGLSSSQARLLSLTGRMHQIEYSAQKIEAQKLQLANETRHVYEDYLNALEMNKIQNKIITLNGCITFRDTTFNNFIGTKADNNSVYILRDLESGRVYVPNMVRNAYENSDRTIDGFLKTLDSLYQDKSSYTSITSAEELMQLSGSTGSFKLDADIELDDWSGINLFKGTFDGNGHKITIKNGTNGLFNSALNATIRNVELEVNINNSESNNVGGLVGQISNSTIENVSVTGTISGNRWIGGAIGYVHGSTNVSNCCADVEVSSDFVSTENGLTQKSKWDGITYGGGFIGKISSANSVIENCISKGNVSSEYSTIGGFIGSIDKSTVEINNCIEEGNVTPNKNGNLEYFDGSSVNRPYQYSGTFIAEYTNNSGVSINDCIAKGVFTNDEDAHSKFTDFGYNMTTRVHQPANNSYSVFANDDIPVISNVVAPSSVNGSDYPNIPSDSLKSFVEFFDIMTNGGGGMSVDEKFLNDPTWFSNIVSNGFAMISTVDFENGFEINDTSVAVDTNLQEVQDYSKIRKAEAKYEADMRRIDFKERKYDYDLAGIENERNAIKQEIETLKTVSKENVDRTFRLFS